MQLEAMSALTLGGIVIFCFLFAAYVFTPYGRFAIEYPVFVLSGKGRIGILGEWVIRLASIATVLAVFVLLSYGFAWIGSAVVSAFTYVTGIALPMP